MFTGLVQTTGEVVAIERIGGGLRLVVRAHRWDYRPQPGDSIAVSGCCLTVADHPGREGEIPFDVVPETLRLTTLGGLVVGSRVNLEPSATLETLVGGHLVQGHVDGLGRVVAVERGEEYRVRIAVPDGLMEFAPPKGSVSVAGVSLTLAAVDPAAGAFEVALIPTTLEQTTLGELKVGDLVNLEMDAMTKAVVHWLKNFGPGRDG
ncbi:MAG: riboflavin synthase [Planctomycetes bacterium]|nr:riboflavin synthase [Planctomycetota bacterium]